MNCPIPSNPQEGYDVVLNRLVINFVIEDFCSESNGILPSPFAMPISREMPSAADIRFAIHSQDFSESIKFNN
jgi:hypothetical protein